MMIRIFCVLFALSFSLTLPAQTDNIFLSRGFWKTNPTVNLIDDYIDLGHDISALNSNAFDGVCYALLEKTSNETIKYLLSKNGNAVNKITHDGRTYLFWAAYKGNLEMMDYLIQNGAKTTIIDSHGNTVLNFAASTGQKSKAVYDILFEHGANITTEKNHDGANALLLIAPYLQSFELADYFLTKGASWSDKDHYGHGIFNYAAKGGNISVLETLIEKGISFKTNVAGGNAFIMASKGTRRHRNTLKLYQFLEQLGISPTVSDQLGRTPLHYMAYRDKDSTLFRYFIARGLDVDAPDDDGNTPFMNATSRNSLAIVKLLAEQVRDINHRNKKGQTALTKAVQQNTAEVVSYLLQKSSDVSVLDFDGNSLMYYLLKSFNGNDPSAFEEKLQLLKRSGLRISENQANGNTLYHLAVEENDLDLVRRLYNFDLDVNQKNKNGLTALHLAAMKATDEKLIKYLLSIGADKTLKTDFEETVYDLASENEILRKNAVDLNFLR
jgi:ankyrin repeat protein